MIIGVTGGTGSGKSTVCCELEKYGCIVLDADAIYKELTMPGSDLVKEIAKEFGDDVLVDGALNRKELARKAFSSNENALKLNAITHGAVKAEMHRRMAENKDKNIILDVPLLFESGMNEDCDEIWTVVAPVDIRIERLIIRDGITPQEALARIKHQISDKDRIDKSDLVIENDTIPHLREQIAQIAKERLNK